jgi:cell division protein FtsQ
MSRSLAAAPGRRRASAPRSRRSAPKSSQPAFGVIRPLTTAANLVRTAAAFVLRRRRLRIALLAAVVALPLLGCAWLWLRQSPFVAVQHVQITGVHGADAQAVESALAQAAHGMSTLDVSDGALAAAVAPLRVVRAVRAIASFPHGLRIDVVEQLPVAALSVGGVRTAVAADGVVLGPALLSGSLPSVSGWSLPAPGRRASGANVLAALTVLGAAPGPFAKHIERVFTGAKGLTVAMRNGLLVYFGDAARPLAKWLALARVLADPSSAGASYVDVRLPSHPAAGFPAGVTPPDASATVGAGSSEQPDSTESTIAALAAGLSGGSATTSATGTEAAASSPSGAASASEPGPEASATESETGAGSGAEAPQTASEPGG